MYNNGTVSNSTTTGYTYDEYWRGLLTGYDGEGITYDAIGNPLSYYNGKRYTFSWLYGRRLASAVVDGKTNTYTYNTEGLRLTKTAGDVVHTCYWDGNTLLMEKWGNSFLRFTYDESGAPLRVHYWNGSESIVFYYVLNLQGDVLEIRDTANNVICRYSYDAWGKLLSVKDGSGNAITSASHIGFLNPLRYRGYYYDTETGLYYLRSRYYDPQVGRFVSADAYISTGQGILGYNMYAYCGNNPINKYDHTGHFPWLIVAAVLLFTPVGGTVLQATTSVVSYAGMAVASIFDEDIRDDMNAIDWNPFNTDESATLNSKKVSFYKGVPVFRTEEDRSGSFGAIFLNQGSDADDLRHERGHNTQLMMMGIGTYGFTVGIPSPAKLGKWAKEDDYYGAPWETMADILGGARKEEHSKEEIWNAWGYYATGALCFPLVAIYWL